MHDLNSRKLVFAVAAFEGPDSYSQAGGLGIRVTGLTRTLAELGFETHLFFVGDPALPGVEARSRGRLILHRWGQWISAWHRGGVYDGEEGKRWDLVHSLPAWMTERLIVPALAAGRVPVLLSEDWQTADFACQLAEHLSSRGLAERVIRFWNANNTYSFDRIDWPRLTRTNRLTAVSRYMRAILRDRGVDARIIPNGIPPRLTEPVDASRVDRLRERLGPRSFVFKMARWGHDKGWQQTLEAIGGLRRAEQPVTLFARGGGPCQGGKDLAPQAARQGLRVCEVSSAEELDARLPELGRAGADVVSLRFGVTEDLARILYAGAGAVLANSIAEPFGLVGLEAMAAGGLVVTSGTGEDYAVDGVNAIVLQSLRPQELTDRVQEHLAHPGASLELRRNAVETARGYAWCDIVRDRLLPAIEAELGAAASRSSSRLYTRRSGKPSAPHSSGANMAESHGGR